MKLNSDGLYSMLFVSTFHPEYIVACKKIKEVKEKLSQEILARNKEIQKGIAQEDLPVHDYIEDEE